MIFWQVNHEKDGRGIKLYSSQMQAYVQAEKGEWIERLVLGSVTKSEICQLFNGDIPRQKWEQKK